MLINDENTKTKEIERSVVKAYLEILGRVPDPKGKMDYTNALMSGCSNISQMRSNLFDSKEYKRDKSLVVEGKIGEDIAHIDSNTGHIVWKIAIDSSVTDEVEKVISKSWDVNDIVFVSTWNIKCGISTYTGHLLRAMNKVYRKEKKEGEKKEINDICSVYSINNGVGWDRINGKLVELEHEFGIVHRPIVSDSKILVTWHSIPPDLYETISEYEKTLNIVGHIIHNEQSMEYIGGRTTKDVWVVAHGSKTFVNMKKEDVRELLGLDGLGINDDEDVAFVFGFQSGTKNFKMLIDACKNIGIKIIISGSPHECGFTNIDEESIDKKNVIFLGRYLNETETDLYALSSDILLFNYLPQEHYSVSGAMHRVIGAGRPCIVSNTKHFLDVEEEKDGVLKFNSGNQGELEQKIKEGLVRRDELGKKALEFARKTSWDNVAKRRLEIYRHYVDI